jgi:sec-independent protein translocase protein TatA
MLLAMLGTMEIVVIIAVVLLIFGPSKLPQLGSGVGKMLRGFKKEMKAIDEDEAADKSKAVADGKDEEIDVTPKKSAGADKAKVREA